MRKTAVLRIRIITVLILFLACVIVVRLYQVQVANANLYAEKGEEQYVHTVNDLYDRGGIYMTTRDNEKVSAATIRSGHLLAIDPSRIRDAEAAYEALNKIIPIEREPFITYATEEGRTYREIEPRVTKSEATSIDELGLSGVQLYRNQWRYYPGDELGARTVGFIGYNGRNELSGRYGLERYYDDILARDTKRLSVNFFAEIFSNLDGLAFDASDEREGDIVTSLEPTVMRTLESELSKVQDAWDSDLSGGIVIDPKNGDIYALSAVPTFNLNDRGAASLEDFRNPLVENVYELGSIIKALTVAAGLDADVITPQTTYYDAGSADYDDYTINNYDGRGRGYANMQEVLNQSLNTGAAHIAVDKLGTKRFSEYFDALKIGSETGVDLPSEEHGLVDNLDSPRKIEYATASFGQGIAMTPIAAVRALSTLANGGTLITPHIAQRIVYENGNMHEVTFPDGDRVFDEATSEEITRMLVTVVDDALGGGDVALENYTVAAKTGTAQIADSENGGYYEDRYLHSFFGYFPAYDPEFLVFLYTVEPKEVRYASETLTEPFMNLTKFLINYYNIPPDR